MTSTATGSTGSSSLSGSGSDSATSDSTTTGSSESESESASTSATSTSSGTESSTGDTMTTGDSDGTTTTTGDNGLWDMPNLWYSVGGWLVYIEIDPMDGSVVQLVLNELIADVPLWDGQNGLTMLEDGSLLGSRERPEGTQIYWVAEPPTIENSPAEAVVLGTIADEIRVEALYTDCDGRVYLMDTGVDTGSSEGNRLLRFSGDYLKGDLQFEVITDLQDASVGDIDDMSPGIDGDEITDGVGFAIDSSVLWQIDYTSGTGTNIAKTDGDWGVHALGGPLFDDMMPRLYILSRGAEDAGPKLLEVNIMDFSAMLLIDGPLLDLNIGLSGWSGLAGPLTECMSTIPQ